MSCCVAQAKSDFDQIEVGERIAHVGIEAGGNDNEFRLKFAKPRQDPVFECGAECFAAVAGFERCIDNRIVFAGLE